MVRSAFTLGSRICPPLLTAVAILEAMPVALCVEVVAAFCPPLLTAAVFEATLVAICVTEVVDFRSTVPA